MQTKVKDLMRKDPEIISGDATLQEAAQKMRSVDCGVLPVGTIDNIEGVITDRDIVVRALAEGINPAEEKVQDYMTRDVSYCNENDTIAQVATQMGGLGVGRLMVQDKSGNLTGVITFGCILRKDNSLREIGTAVERAVGKKAA